MTGIPSKFRLSGNIAVLTLLQMLMYATPLITVPHLVRALGAGPYGVLTFTQAVVLHLDFLTDYGFNLSSTRAVAIAKTNNIELGRVFWTTIAAKLCIMAACAIALAVAIFCSPKLFEARWLYAGCFISVIGTAVFPVWLFRGLEQFAIFAGAFGSARLLTIPLIYTLVKGPRDLVTAAMIQASVEVVAAALVIPLVKRVVPWYRPSICEVSSRLREGWPLFIAGVALFLSTSSTTLLLGLTTSTAVVAYYAAADKLIRACSAMLTPLSGALFPFIAAARGESSESAVQVIRGSLALTTSLGLMSSIATFVLARPVANLVLGPAFAPSGELLRWLSPLPALWALADVLGTQTLVVFQMDSVMSRSIMISAFCGLPLMLVLSKYLGAPGAAIANTVVAGMMLTGMTAAIQSRGLPIFFWKPSVANAE